MDSEFNNSPLKKIGTFIVVVFALSCPFWLAGYWFAGIMLPGLPVSALMAIVPALAALILTAKACGRTPALRLAQRATDFQRSSLATLALAALVMPTLYLGAWTWMIFDGVALPLPDISPVAIAGLFAVFWIAAFGEELGWSGFLAKPAMQCWGRLGAGLTIGTVAALWHFVPLAQAGRDWGWIVWWAVGTIAVRVVILTIYRLSNESVFAVSTLHAAQNVAWQAFPMNGSHYDPSYTAPIFLIAATVCTALFIHKRQL